MLRVKSIVVIVGLIIGCGMTSTPVKADDEAELKAAWRQAYKLEMAAEYEEAVTLYQKALKLANSVYGENHRNTASIVNNLANLYRLQGKYEAAEPLYKRALAIREKVLGADHTDVGMSLNNMAILYRLQANNTAAKNLYERAIAVYEKASGKDHIDVAGPLNNLANLYADQGLYEKAGKLYERSLTIKEKTLGREHVSVAQTLDNLGALSFNQGRYKAAEAFHKRSLEIYGKAIKPDHPDVTQPLFNLATLYVAMGKYEDAELLLKRSLAVSEQAFGKEHHHVAQVLNGLGGLYLLQKKHAAAEPLFERCLIITEQTFGKKHPEVARSLNNLALLYQELEKDDKAESFFKRALSITEQAYGKDHPEVARSLLNLAGLYHIQGKYTTALPLCVRSLAIGENTTDNDPLTLADSRNNLAILYSDLGKFAEAVVQQHRLRRSTREFLLQELPYLSAREQQDFLNRNDSKRIAYAVTLGVHLGKDQAIAVQSAEWLLNGKAIALEAQSLNTLLEKQAEPALLEKLRELRSQEAVLALRVGDAKQAEAISRERQAIQALRRQLEKQIALAGGAAASLASPWIDLAHVRKSIPQDGVLVEIVRFEPARFNVKPGEKHWDAARYVAWIIPPAGEVKIVDLGQADIIERQVKAVRETMTAASKLIREVGEPEAEAKVNESLAKLADQVFKPLVPHLGKAKSLILSPDGELWLAPWAAMPVGKDRYLIEDFSLHLVISGRDLASAPLAKKPVTSAPLVLADPDFDAIPGKAGGAAEPARSLSQDVALLKEVRRLPGTASEAEAITPKLKLLASTAPILHTDDKATEAVVKAAVRPRVLVLSTHGFFMPTQHVETKEKDRFPSEGNRSSAVLTKDGKIVENPLLRCGLLLAGCNKRDRAKAGEDDGVLTGLEIVGTDLRGTEMVVLSACETGLGDVQNGQGVAGLRQAFQLAGAESVVATLWQIPDVQSAQLMVAFFDNLANKDSRGEALQKAQREIIEKRRKQFGAAHPYYWAAYTLTCQAK